MAMAGSEYQFTSTSIMPCLRLDTSCEIRLSGTVQTLLIVLESSAGRLITLRWVLRSSICWTSGNPLRCSSPEAPESWDFMRSEISVTFHCGFIRELGLLDLIPYDEMHIVAP